MNISSTKMSTPFKNSLENDKVVYYHFLDSLIDSGSGYTINKIIEFIGKNEIINNDTTRMKDIFFLTLESQNDDKDQFYFNYKYSNITTKEEHVINYNMKDNIINPDDIKKY